MMTSASAAPIFAVSSATVAGSTGTFTKPLLRSTSIRSFAVNTAAYGSPSLSCTSPT